MYNMTCLIVLQWKCSWAISKWRKVKTWTMLSTFLRFLTRQFNKTQKVAFFWIFKKNVKTYSRTMLKPCTSRVDVLELINCKWENLYPCQRFFWLNDDVPKFNLLTPSPLLPYGYSYKASYARPGSAVICNFWHLSTLTPRADTGCFIAVSITAQWAWKG